jgi:beta-barrel assembly-enhancing protease
MAIFVLLLTADFLRAQNTKSGDLTAINMLIPSIPAGVEYLDSRCEGSTDHELRFLTEEQRAELNVGRRLAFRISQEETVEYDSLLVAYLNSLEHKLVNRSGLKGCFVVQLIADDDINAYSLPGGFIYLTTGLALSAESEGELVAALAHETGHVMARHFSRIEHKRQAGHRFMLAGGPPGYVIARALRPIFVRRVMRSAEFEADRLSLQYQSASGYDPTDLTRLLRNIDQQNRSSGSLFSRLFDSHPSIVARLQRIGPVIKHSTATHASHTVDDGDFRAFKQRLYSRYGNR